MRRSFKSLKKVSCRLKTAQGMLSFTLARSSRRRTLAIYIDENAEVSVYAPTSVSEENIHAFLHQKESWIRLKKEEAQARQDRLADRSIFRDNELMFIGKKYPLQVDETSVKNPRIQFDGLKVTVSVPQGLPEDARTTLIKKKLIQWYHQQAKEILGGRIFHYSRILGVEPKEVAIRTQKRLWGICDYNKQSISLNWQIILSPFAVIDYVVVHELCHLFVPNHSARFWKKVEKILPDFKTRRQWLKKNAPEITMV